jgi:Cyclic nucleotide-binding domain
MRIESSVTAISWIPSEAVEGIARVPYTLGLRGFDDPPPDRLDDLDRFAKRHPFRLANELRGWIEVRRGVIVDHGLDGRALAGATRVRLGPRQLSFPAATMPLVQSKPELGPGWVRFVQTGAVRLGLPAATAWTTVGLVLYATGQARGSLVRASGFPRHWVYDGEGRLAEKSGAITFDPAAETLPTVVLPAESELERSLADAVLGGGAALERRRLAPSETLVRQGEPGDELFVVVDGVLDVEVDGAVVAQAGPGAVLGELAVLEGGTRTATLRAVTACRVAVLAGDQISRYELQELAATRRAEGDVAG